MRVPKAPATLSRDASALWRKLLAELGEFEESQLLILRTGLEQWDMLQRAQAQIGEDGLMVADRFGQLKAHPLTSVMRDSASGVRAMYKLLGLDFVEVAD